MFVKLKAKSQVTIPKEIVHSLALNLGDSFEIREEEGKIVLIPVAVYPKHIIRRLNESVDEVKDSIRKGEQLMFDSIDALFEELEK